MALAFKCKQCGQKYRNVSAEFSGCKVRCVCGRIQRLHTLEEIEARERKRRQRKYKKNNQSDVEVVSLAPSRTVEEDVFDLATHSVSPSSHFNSVETLRSSPHDSDPGTELSRETDWPDDDDGPVSTLPTLPPGYFNNFYKRPQEERPTSKSLNYLAFASGVGAAILGVILCAVSTRMLLAGASGSSFLDPINGLQMTLCTDAGVRIAAFALFVAATGLLVGGVSQLASALVDDDSTVTKLVWPDRVVAIAGIGFVLLISFELLVINQVKSKKLQFRQANMVKSLNVAQDQRSPIDSDFVTGQRKAFQDTKDAANRGVKSLFLRSLPLCFIAVVISILSLIHYRNTRQIAGYS